MATNSTYAQRGILVRLVYLAVAILWYVLSAGGRIYRDRVIVLCYHGVLVRQRQRFRRQMSWIAGRAVSPDELGAVPLREGRAVPGVMVTFDDAFANLLDNALPALEAFDIPAMIFAVTGNLGERPHWQMPQDHPEAEEPVMTATQVAAVARNRSVRVGSHTVTHADLTRVSSQRAQDELCQSKQCMEDLLGTSVEDFALPHGAFNDLALRTARSVGYRRIYILEPRLYEPRKGGDVIGRFSMSPDVWPIEFYLTCAGAYAWLHGWRRLIRAIRRSPVH